jgi:hypothetical protein
VLAEVAGRTYELDPGDSIKIRKGCRILRNRAGRGGDPIIISPPTF